MAIIKSNIGTHNQRGRYEKLCINLRWNKNETTIKEQFFITNVTTKKKHGSIKDINLF